MFIATPTGVICYSTQISSRSQSCGQTYSKCGLQHRIELYGLLHRKVVQFMSQYNRAGLDTKISLFFSLHATVLTVANVPFPAADIKS